MTDGQISTHAQLFDLTGKNALVTGGTRGIGMMMARGLLQAGARVVISSRKADACAAAEAQLSAFGEVKAVPADLSQHDECIRLAGLVTAEMNDLHILVNNAGATWGEALESFPDSAWDRVLDLNVKSPFWLVQALLPALRRAGTADDPARVIMSGRPGRMVNSPRSMIASPYVKSPAYMGNTVPGAKLIRAMLRSPVAGSEIPGAAASASNVTPSPGAGVASWATATGGVCNATVATSTTLMSARSRPTRRMMILRSFRAVTQRVPADYAASGIGAARKGSTAASS